MARCGEISTRRKVVGGWPLGNRRWAATGRVPWSWPGPRMRHGGVAADANAAMSAVSAPSRGAEIRALGPLSMSIFWQNENRGDDPQSSRRHDHGSSTRRAPHVCPPKSGHPYTARIGTTHGGYQPAQHPPGRDLAELLPLLPTTPPPSLTTLNGATNPPSARLTLKNRERHKADR